MKKTHRIYGAAPYNGCIRRVEVIETYMGSMHYYVKIIPEGYGESPDPILMGRGSDESSVLLQAEGYGIFRIEHAHYIASALSGSEEYVEAA